MKKSIALFAVVAMFMAVAFPVAAFAVGNGEQAQLPGECQAGECDGDQTRDRLQTRECVIDPDCTVECDGDQPRTRTQSRVQTKTQTQPCDPVNAQVQTRAEMSQQTGEPCGSQVKTRLRLESEGQDGPTAAAVSTRAQVGDGFFGGIGDGLHRFAMRVMAWLGLA